MIVKKLLIRHKIINFLCLRLHGIGIVFQNYARCRQPDMDKRYNLLTSKFGNWCVRIAMTYNIFYED